MSERKINLDNYINELPLAVAFYRKQIKEVLKDFAKELLELAAENAQIHDGFSIEDSSHWVDKESIINTINQIKI